MKKLLSVLLTLSMLLTLLIVPISAGGTEPEDGDEFTPVDLGTAETPRNTTTEGGVEYYTDANSVKYIVIRDADDFKAMTGTNNYIFANNIDLENTVTTGSNSVISGWSGVLDGNGYSLTGFSFSENNAGGLFNMNVSGGSSLTVRNLTFGSATSPIVGTTNGNGGMGVVSGKLRKTTALVENCVAYVDFSSGSKSGAAVGAFFGGNDHEDGGSVTMRDCVAYGTINCKNKVGGLFGNNKKNSDLTFENCTNNVTVTGTQHVGGFLGLNDGTATVTLTNCTNTGNVTATATDSGNAGGFIGKDDGTTIFTKCSNSNTVVVDGPTSEGMFIGFKNAIQNISIITDNANFNYNGLIGSHPYGTKTTRGNVLFSKTVSGLQTLAAAKAAYFQTAAGSAEGLQNVRVLLALPESEIANIKNIEFKVVFKNLNVNEGATTKTLTVTDADAAIASYYSVIADTKIAEAPEGYVMVAVVVTDVDTSVWTASGANLEVYMTSAGGTNTIYNNTPEADNKNP